MISTEKLKSLGCNIDEALERCMGDIDFYIECLPEAFVKERYEKLEELIKEKNYNEAFEAAHALKGVLANLSLDPMFEPVSNVTEALRSRTDMDYSGLLSEMWERFAMFQRELNS